MPKLFCGNPSILTNLQRRFLFISERLNVLYEKNWTKLVTEQLKRFEKVVVESGNSPVSKRVEDHWTFGGALLYTLTLLTTVGYGKLSPKTTLGKIIAMIYALIGVPLMLVLLSLLGSMLANGAKIAYSKIRCKDKTNKQVNTVVGFHKASSGSGKNKNEDCSIQILPHNNQNSVNYKTQEYHIDHLDVPKKAILATVRASHARGRCRQGQVRQMLADPHFCPSTHHGTTSRSITGSLTSDVEETEENEDSEHG
nr:TWiK family of potassium channels protein 18-like [Onthophagus taurus]